MNTDNLTQEKLAQVIDTHGLPFEVFDRCNPLKNWVTPHVDIKWSADDWVSNGATIRLASGALTGFGLLPGMVPHNPDGLAAEQITEGGKYRAITKEEGDGRHGSLRGGKAEVWAGGQWVNAKEGIYYRDTYRVPILTPFLEAQAFQAELDQKLASMSNAAIEEALDVPKQRTPRTDRAQLDGLGKTWERSYKMLIEVSKSIEVELAEVKALCDELYRAAASLPDKLMLPHDMPQQTDDARWMIQGRATFWEKEDADFFIKVLQELDNYAKRKGGNS